MTAKQTYRLTFSIAVAVIFVWLILRRISPEEIKQAFYGINLTWVMTALLAFALGYSCRIERWRMMLQHHNPNLTWNNCAGPLLASVAVNNVLPFRAGDVVRVFWFNRKLGISFGVSIATLFVERLLDFLVLLILLGAALCFFGMDSSHLVGVGSAALILGGAAVLCALLFPDFFAPIALAMCRLIGRISPKLAEKLLDEINKSRAILQDLARGNTMIKLVSWSLLAWLAEGLVFWLGAVALPSITVPLSGWLALPAGTLATLIPSTPGYVGTFDYFTVRAMTELGNSNAAATAYALLVHALLWFPPTLVGGVYLLLHPIRRQDKLKQIFP